MQIFPEWNSSLWWIVSRWSHDPPLPLLALDRSWMLVVNVDVWLQCPPIV